MSPGSNMPEPARFVIKPGAQYSKAVSACIWILSEPLRLANFAYRPGPDREDISGLARTSRMVFWLLILFLCNTVYFDFLPDPEPRFDIVAWTESKPYWQRLIIPCLIAPVFEELIFRAGLRNPYYLFCWGVPIVGIMYYFAFDQSPVPVAVVAMYFAWVGIRLRTNPNTTFRQFVNERCTHAYRPALWSYTLAFGLVHVANFTDGLTAFNVLYVVPHTMIGLVLAYLRIKDGLGFAVVLHGSINFLYLNWQPGS